MSLDDVNQTLDMYLGSLYVNSFNDFGRHWQVTVQADGEFRNRVEDINLFRCATTRARWCRWARWSRRARSAARSPSPATTSTPPRPSTATCAPGVSTGDAINAIDTHGRRDAAAVDEDRLDRADVHADPGGQHGDLRLPAGGVCVFLALSALYESWTLPLAVILVVPLCLLCSVAGVLFTHRDVNIFVQIGLVVLVALACKNAILIVEYAKQLHREGPVALTRPRKRRRGCGCGRS